ncbi:vWA domain-containing protein [Thalassococcus lentus]|uniref:von Willebrand factor type A domain-containing protein n=1 Tax=Thalassococcus lentus TaxID=1210524 RepID=A0ABT4XMQ8_9RHOB|nr:von Willebrand factor type A domain-containing protein [Thalassococcus lentus]MDA7423230.1 von Willebrand factor type A domain-containing protein [Thalassococcus lentus]
MSDDLDDLKRALDASVPTPDADKKAAAIALAMKNFDRAQESTDDTRQTSDRPAGGLFRGVRNMFANFSTRGVMGATTALAAVTLMAFIPTMQGHMPELPGTPVQQVKAPEPEYSGGGLLSVQSAGQGATSAPMVIARDAAPADLAIAPRPAPSQRKMAPANMYSGGAGNNGVLLSMPQAESMPIIDDRPVMQEADTEAFPDADANPIKVTAEDPVSTFSIDVDTASWSILRNSLTGGMLPPEGSVRIEEMVNYFSYDYPAPDDGQAFASTVGVQQTPWNADTQLVHIALQGALPAERPPMNLVFLIDTSGSMNQPNKLPLLKQSFRLMLGQLSAEDSVSIVTYAGSAGRVLDPTPATERETILAALDNLRAGGGTAGQAGLQQAYATAAEMAEEGEVSRVILATDGDFNIGINDPEELEKYIADKREDGTYLSVLGFGRGNLDDATMQSLAQFGNGMAAYIDTLAEAQKVLVDQLTGALVPIADDVKIQVEFNPATVAEYRLIGYETRALRREDFNNDAVDAGEIGAGHQVTALYEITPVGSPARLTDPLRYGETAAVSDSDELGFLRLRYKAPGEDESQLIEAPISADQAPLADAQFAAAIAGFGQLLRGSDYVTDWNFADAISLAQSARGEDTYGYRQEAVTLMRLAESLSR